jgi:hypothetical protein
MNLEIDNYKNIFNFSKKEPEYPIKYLKILLKNDNIICNRPLIAIHNFIPLPTKLELDSFHTGFNKIIYEEEIDEYQFHGTPGNRLVFANRSLPFIYYNIPIPFTFPIYKSNMLKPIQSNVFYYEVTIKPQLNLEYMWNSQCISIGFSCKKTPINSHVGWFNNSVGFHSDDGTVRFNDKVEATIISRKWEAGDTIGAGLIYIKKTIVCPFFTFNGNICYKFSLPIKMALPYFPCIGYDHPNSIDVNFSKKEFVFDIENFIPIYSNEIIMQNNDFFENPNMI